MRTFSFENKAQSIFCYAWDEVENPKAIVQLAHDECDHSLRYAELARFLNTKGYIVVSQDLRGFGKSSNGFAHRGEFYGDVFQYSVDDMINLTNMAIGFYSLPVVLVGIGYGSILAQSYSWTRGDLLSGLVLIGSAYMRDAKVLLAGILAGILSGFVDPQSPSYLISNLTYKLRAKPFLSEKTRYSFLTRDSEEIKKYVQDNSCGAQFVLSLNFDKSFLNYSYWMYSKKRFKTIPQKLPILLMSGSDDYAANTYKSVDVLYGKLVKYGRKNVLLNVYPSARHDLIHETNKDEVFEDLLIFLDTIFKK